MFEYYGHVHVHSPGAGAGNPLLRHAKFQNHRPSDSGEEWFKRFFAIYSHGGHLGDVTLTIHINFHCPFLTMLHIKFSSDWPSRFREDV